MRLQDEGTCQADAEESSKKYKDGLREHPNCHRIQTVEHDGPNDSRECLHEPNGAKDLPDTRRGNMLGDSCLDGGASKASESSDHSTGKEEVLIPRKDISKASHQIRSQSKSENPNV